MSWGRKAHLSACAASLPGTEGTLRRTQRFPTLHFLHGDLFRSVGTKMLTKLRRLGNCYFRTISRLRVLNINQEVVYGGVISFRQIEWVLRPDYRLERDHYLKAGNLASGWDPPHWKQNLCQVAWTSQARKATRRTRLTIVLRAAMKQPPAEMLRKRFLEDDDMFRRPSAY